MNKLFILTFMSIMCFHIHGDEGPRPSRLLLSSFANQCPQVVTRNVTATLLSLQSLYNTIEELKKDTNCGGVMAFSNAVTRYNTLYENFELESSESHDKIKLENKIALYTGLFDNPSIDASQKNYLQNEIISSQASLININSNLNRFGNFSGKEARVANQLVKAADDFFTELQTSQGNSCYQKNPAKIASIMSNALLVTSAFSSSGTSLALASSAVIVKSVGKFIGDFKYNKTLEKAQDIEMPTALRCVSQALTDQYCSTNEIHELITDRIGSINNRPGLGFEGLNLLSYQLSALGSWLEEVYSGSAITSEGDLANREKAEIQSEFLRKMSAYLETFGTIKRRFFLSLDNGATLKTAISQNIECLVLLVNYPSLNPCGMMIETSIENPIFSQYSRSLLAYELLEPGVHSKIPRCGPNLCSSFSEYINEYNISLSIGDWDRVIKNASNIVQSTKALVNIERSKMISVDAYSIMVNAKREFKGITSPINGLKKIVSNADRISKYLSELGCRLSNDCEGQNNKYAAEIRNIQKTKDLTTDIINLVNEGVIPRSIPKEILPKECVNDTILNFIENNVEDVLEVKSFQITSCISKILKLRERGTSVYFSKVRDMISYEMEARLLNNDLGSSVEKVINSNKLDLVQSILNSYSVSDNTISLGELNISLESAQNNSKQALILFFDFFKSSVIDSLKSSDITQTEKNDLCIRILPYIFSAKESFIKTIYPFCQRAVFQTYKNGPIIRFIDYVTVTPRKGLKSAKYSLSDPQEGLKYFCNYRKYNRTNLLIDEQNMQRPSSTR